MASDELSNYLMSGSRHAQLSPESLELLGKQAANMFLREGVPLNEGIAKLAGAHQDISPEQVKRVVEFANTAVYLSRHDQSKTAGAASSYPQFSLADAGRILQDLGDGARPTVVTPTDVDYARAPESAAMKKVAMVVGGPKSRYQLLKEASFAAAFGRSEDGLDKTAEATFTHETAEREVMDAKNMLDGLKGHLERSGEQFDLMLKESQAGYYAQVKEHLLDGGAFVDVMAAARSSGVDATKVAQVLAPVVERLLAEKVASPRRLHQSAQGLDKVAHRVVNPQHPLVTGFSDIVVLEGEIAKVAHGLAQVDEGLGRVDSFIRERLRAAGSAH